MSGIAIGVDVPSGVELLSPGTNPDGTVRPAVSPTEAYEVARRRLDKVSAGGFHGIRLGTQPWMAEPVHLAHLRSVLAYAKQRKLQVSFTTAQLANNPDQTPAKMLEVNTRYIGSVADAVADLVDYWQVLNEWDAGDWRTRTAGAAARGALELPDEYLEATAEMIAACRDRIKRADATTLVYTAVQGQDGDRNTERRWRHIFDGPVGKAVDALGLNVYIYQWEPPYEEMPARLERIAARYGKPIIISEFGLPSSDQTPEEVRGYWLGRQVGTFAAAPSVLAAFHYQWADRKGVEGAEGRFGLEGKPAAQAALAAAMVNVHGGGPKWQAW